MAASRKAKSRRPTVGKPVAKKRPAVRKKIAVRKAPASRATLGKTAVRLAGVGYEQARGLRAKGQKVNGFSATASKTVRIPLDKLYTAWSEPRQRSRWLPDAPIEVRRATDGRSLRITWKLGESSIDVGFYAKGGEKSMVAVEHSKLPDATAATRQKHYWGDALGRLKALLEPK